MVRVVRPRIKAPSRVLRYNAIRRGVFGGSRPWTAVAVVMYSASLISRVVRRQPEVVSIEKLRPGQFVRVEALTGLSKAERKAILKAR